MQNKAATFQKMPCGAKEGRKGHLFGGARYDEYFHDLDRLTHPSLNDKRRKVGQTQNENPLLLSSTLILIPLL